MRPENLLGGGTLSGWIAAGPAATLRLQWTGRRSIDEIQLTAATTGIAAEPTRVLITSPDGTRDVPVPQDGILRFPALVTDRLDVSFPGVMPTTAYNPLLGRAQQLPVGIGALTIPALAGLNAGVPAASTPFRLACGQGPPVTLDGHVYPTAVSGIVGELINLTPLSLRLCTPGSALTLTAGRHWLTSPGTGVALAVTSLSLTDAGGAPPTATGAPAASRSLRIGSWGTEYRTATIGPGALAYLEVHQAANPGWTATLNGKPLTAVTLDGWQQAFIVPRGAGGAVVMSFSPVTGYHWLLLGSVLAVCALIAAAAWPWRRPRRRPAAESPRPAGAAGYVGYWVAVAGAALVLAVSGGPLAVVVPFVILLGRWRPRWVPWLAFAAMCIAGVLVITGLSRGPEPGFGAFAWPAQAAALIALAAALTPAGRRPWLPPELSAVPGRGAEDDQ